MKTKEEWQAELLHEGTEILRPQVVRIQADAYRQGFEDAKEAAYRAQLAERDAQLAVMVAYLQGKIKDAPTEEPERYEGSNSGDSEQWAWEFDKWCDAKEIRPLLASCPTQAKALAEVVEALDAVGEDKLTVLCGALVQAGYKDDGEKFAGIINAYAKLDAARG